MTLTLISENAIPAYIALTTDIGVDDRIVGANNIGKLIYMLDSAETYIINADLTLSEYALPVSVTVSSDIEIGAVEIKDGTADTRATVGENGLHVDVKSSVLAVGASTSANQTDGSQQTKIKETSPTDITKNNPSLNLTYDGSNLTTISKVINGVTYNKTLSYTGSILDSVSAWVVV